VFRAVRRFVVPALVGLFGLVLGLTIGFAVDLRKRFADPTWLEAIGTWVGAGATLLAVIIAGIVFFSEEYARRREERHQSEAAEAAREAQLQQQADLVACDVLYNGSETIEPDGVRVMRVNSIVLEVQNNSSYTVRNVFCRVTQLGDEIKLSDVLIPGARSEIHVEKPFTVPEDHRKVNERGRFRFSLGGVEWLGRYAQPAERLGP
jgi:hypothetical protein